MSQDRLDRIEALVRKHVPGLRLVDKRTVWWMRLAGRALRPVNPRFMSDYTVVIGDTVYLPGPRDAQRPEPLAATLAHELVHQLDQREHGLSFYLSYALLPMPFWRTGRAHWERRAYAVDLMLAYERGGAKALWALVDRLADLFSGPEYGYMWGGRDAAHAYLGDIAQGIEAEQLQKQLPYAEILQAWRGNSTK